MPLEGFLPPRRGAAPRAGDLSRMQQELQAHDRVTGTATMQVRRNGGGFQFDPLHPLEFWAEITGTLDSYSGDNSGQSTCTWYSWRQVYDRDCDWIEWPDGLVGSLLMRAREANNNDDVEAGTIVWMRLAPSGDFFIFEWGSTTQCEDTLITMHNLKCEDGRLRKYVIESTQDSNGCITVSDPIYVGDEGCCDCDGDGSGSGSGPSSSSATLPSGSGGSGGSGSGAGGCCPDVTLPDKLYATISAPGYSWLDGEVIPLAGTGGAGGQGVWSGAKWDGGPQGCFFPLHLTCCGTFPGLGLDATSCDDYVINAFIDPTIYNVSPCTSAFSGWTPYTCSCDPFTLIFQASFFGTTNPNLAQRRFRCGTGCRPRFDGTIPIDCTATWTITITT